MDKNMINNLKSESRWLRLVFMALFAVVGYLAILLVFVLSVIQVVHGFIKGEGNARLLQFSAGLNQFIYQVAQFLAYNSDEKPYPFSNWPDQVDNEAFDVTQK
ncbi:hypothetical protein ACH42_14940 [Endozoicomonas sp. (ex Bugula neritina AB1)]|nr:hypothetical protein ACH42_14940 [Endozoicomonas sp. (ex Bugula neritina AB1)]